MTQKLTLTDSGTRTFTITGITFMETYATSISQTNTHGTSVAARASCSIAITFKPTQASSLKGRQSRITLPVHPDISLERNIYWYQPGGEPISSQARLCLHSNRCSNRRTVARTPSEKVGDRQL